MNCLIEKLREKAKQDLAHNIEMAEAIFDGYERCLKDLESYEAPVSEAEPEKGDEHEGIVMSSYEKGVNFALKKVCEELAVECKDLDAMEMPSDEKAKLVAKLIHEDFPNW